MTISERYFTGKENLAIRAIVESFDSDPDIFISKVSNHQPFNIFRPTRIPLPQWIAIGIA